MNQKQFEIWRQQKWREYDIELRKLQEDYAGRGLASSGLRNQAERDLKRKYESEIEITRLGLEDEADRGHVTVRLNKSAKNNFFINSPIRGGLEIAGQGSSFIETKVEALKRDHPFWFWFGALGTLIGIVTGLIFFAQYFGLLGAVWDNNVVPTPMNENFATSTTNLATMLAKNNNFNTRLEKQNFIDKYSNTRVFGQGSFEDIEKVGEAYIVQMLISKNLVACQFSFEFEKPLLLLSRGQIVNFYGDFTGSGLAGYGAINPWYIESCTLLNSF